MTKILGILLIIFFVNYVLSETSYERYRAEQLRVRDDIPLFTPEPRDFQVLEENQNFSVSFYNELRKATPNRERNLVFAPFAIQVAGAALYIGADGDTAEQLELALHLPSHDKTTLSSIYGVYKSIKDARTLFKIGTKIYIKRNYSIKPTFQDVIASSFSTNIESIEFNENSLNAAKSINDWASRVTNGGITKVIRTDDINRLTRLLLFSVSHLKMNWKHKFDKKKTKKGIFLSSPNRVRHIDMMHGRFSFRAAVHNELKVSIAKLRFMDPYLSLYILMPSLPTIKLEEVENNLMKLLINDAIFNKLGADSVKHIVIPKFKIESHINMADVFINLGIVKMFSSTANFSSLVNSTEPIQCSNVFHKSIIDVGEDGDMSGEPYTEEFEDPNVFKVNQSFLYFVVGNTGEIFFMGRYTG